MASSINIAGRSVSEEEEVFVIAEVGINHNGNMETAKELIDKAAGAGASAVKIQTYITEKRVPADSPIFDLLKKCELSFDQQKELMDYAVQKQILIFSTPFDNESVDFLVSVDVPCFKVASFDIVNTVLLEYVAAQGKPVIASRGMASKKEIDAAVDIFRAHKTPFALLHCISAYPVPSSSDLHLSTIGALYRKYNCPVGFSDHSQGIEASIIACAAGASVIEKHFVLSGDESAPDYGVSINPEQFARMVKDIRHTSVMLGKPLWGSVDAEAEILQYRRST